MEWNLVDLLRLHEAFRILAIDAGGEEQVEDFRIDMRIVAHPRHDGNGFR